MNQLLPEKFGIEKIMFLIIVIAVIAVVAAVLYLFYGSSSRSVELISPMGREEWEIGQTYDIKWTARGVNKIGIVLFNGDNPEWIAENLSASSGSYNWKIQPGHAYGSNFWVAVVEYPWKNGNLISYSKGSFSITFPELASCDELSIQNDWPFLASDIPDIRRVFITKEQFNGDLGGLDGANEKCQKAAIDMGYSGNWTAFIGGENPEDTAVKRIERTPRGTFGVFVDAFSSLELLRGATCHRLLGNDFNTFLEKLSNKEVIDKVSLSDEFLAKMQDIWIGRIDDTSKRSCIAIDSVISSYSSGNAERYSYTPACQNWSYGDNTVSGYSRNVQLNDAFPSCYTVTGEFTYAVGTGGLATDLKGERSNGTYTVSSGKFCSDRQYLMCIED